MDESDDDDVEAQCRLIFEQYEAPEQTEASTATASLPSDSTNFEDSLSKYDDSQKRKRVAYENADHVERPTQAKASNHVQAAMQVKFPTIFRIIFVHQIKSI